MYAITPVPLDNVGLSLASAASSGNSILLRGDYGIYAVFEQKLYRVGSDDFRGIGIFARTTYSPPDQTLKDFYADEGLRFIGLSEQITRSQIIGT